MKLFCCDIISHLQGELRTLLSSSLALLCMYHLKFMQSNAILPQLLFQLALLYPLSLLLTPSSNDAALPELTAGYVSLGVWIFYKCSCHIHVLLVQTEQVPFLWEVQIPPLKAEANQRADQSACARFSLIKMLPLVTQNSQTSLSHLQGDFRVQEITDRTWPVPYLCYMMPLEERCSTPPIPV